MIGERSENNQNQSIIKAFAENQKCIKSQFSKYKNEIEFDRNALVRNSVHWIPVTRANAGRHTDGAESRRRFRSPSRTKCSCGIGDRPFRPSRESRCSRVSFTRLVATKRCSRWRFGVEDLPARELEREFSRKRESRGRLLCQWCKPMMLSPLILVIQREGERERTLILLYIEQCTTQSKAV